MDLALWMQEDGTNIFGALIVATDIFNKSTVDRMVKHFVVRARAGRNCIPVLQDRKMTSWIPHAHGNVCAGKGNGVATADIVLGCLGAITKHRGRSRHAH